MWIYYGLIVISVVMFAGGFALNDIYRRKRGSGLKISMESAFIGSFAGLIVLCIIDGFSFTFTWFTLLMATLAALNSISFTFCSFKALDKINLSLYSLFCMLGGMVLPFFQGIFFYGEAFTLAKGVCVLFICLALACTVEKGEKKNGTLYYIGIFLLNGMAGVISKIFTASNLPKTSEAGYSVCVAMATIVLAGGVWCVLTLLEKRKRSIKTEEMRVEKPLDKKCLWQACAVGAVSGIVNKVANFLLLIALVRVETSVQYPMVTGGTMIVSTILCFFGDKKPSKKEILSVALAFIGTMALFLIPV